ncbi:MBL fold metallo-hydrolase [Pseudactinotalea sp.]|uniref:MBL fold metallo-hydrolase n=1 Tax=Pseudactinotalea sp. TaxID=1926260 RepID=UPI003B3B5126
MRLVVVGCSGSVSGPDSASSCYLVQADEGDRTTSVLLDLGSGAFGQLLRYVAPEELDAVLLSHLHADHMVDVAALEVYLKYGPGAPHRPMPLWGPEGTCDRVAQVSGEPSEGGPVFDTRVWQPGEPVRLGPLVIEPFPVRHPVPAFAMRITGPAEDGTGPRTLVYTGDTDSCEGVVAAAADAHLLLAEAAFEEGRDEVRGIHLTGRRAGELATEARAERLVLTHIPPWTSRETVRAEACTAYGGPVDLAQPGAAIAL